MLPVALGTQSQGSILRPAAYCGVVGFKPTFGALPMQGVHPITATHDHLGVLASTLDDAWRVASHLSITHGSPGHPYLNGASAEAPRPKMPRRLIRLHMRAWESEVDQATRETFESFIDYVKGAGVEIVDRTSNGDVRDFEAALDDGFVQRSIDITTYEMKWPYLQYVEKYGDMIEQRIHDRMARAQHMTYQEYATLLVDKQVMRERARKVMAGTDGIVTLAASGPAPVGRENTGSRTYLVYATFLGIPAFSLPLLTVDGMPLGVQLIGRANTDGRLAATAGWLTNKLERGRDKPGSSLPV
jgi:Asp-tRNA(Asn)/Glu-tRNA(Gln) amidotransferase A subunit family amidase